MKKIKNIINKNRILITSFFTSLIVISIIFYLQDVAPFGKKSLLTIDFFHQYGPMLGELYDRIKNGNSLIYSFSMGMGLPFFRNFFNYLSSPFNIIMFLFEKKDLLMSYSIIIGLKVCFSSTFMCYYLKEKFNKNNYLFICLSLLYAFCAYFIAYYWNIMWLDGLVFLPLIILGIEKIVNGKKPLLYMISLALMLFSNYFIAWMICIFSVLYYLIYLFIKTERFCIKTFKNMVIFAISSLLVGGICSWFLLPMYNGIGAISATGDVFPTSQYYDFTVKEFLYNHLSGGHSSVLKSDGISAPNISCGILTVALYFLFLFNKNINKKVKIGYSTLLIILLLSFFIAPVDYIWHAFHVPNDLPYRYSFLYSFVLIVIGAYSLINIKKVDAFYVFLTYGLCLTFIYYVFKSEYSYITSDMLWVNAIVLTIFLLIYILFKYFNNKQKLVVFFSIIAIMFECVIKVNNNWDISHDIDSFYTEYDNIINSITFINKNNTEMNRVEKYNMLSLNDSSWYGYNGINTFSSMEYENFAALQYNLGMPGNEINSFYYKENTPIYNLMFNLKYVIGDDINDYYNYSLYFDGDIDIYKSFYTNGLLFGVNKNIKNWTYNFSNPINNQNDFVNKSANINNILELEAFKSKEIVYNEGSNVIVKYTFDNPNSNYYYYIDNYGIDFVYNENKLLYLNENYGYKKYIKEDINIYEFISYHEKYIVTENSFDEEVVFYVGYNNYYNDIFNIYSINNDKLNMLYNYYLNNKISINSFKEHEIIATSNLKNSMTCYTSIPYDDGWKVYIDGKKADTYLIGNALLGFDIDSGEHDIVLKYNLPYFKLGFVISLCSLLGIIVINNKKINKGINN